MYVSRLIIMIKVCFLQKQLYRNLLIILLINILVMISLVSRDHMSSDVYWIEEGVRWLPGLQLQLPLYVAFLNTPSRGRRLFVPQLSLDTLELVTRLSPSDYKLDKSDDERTLAHIV